MPEKRSRRKTARKLTARLLHGTVVLCLLVTGGVVASGGLVLLPLAAKWHGMRDFTSQAVLAATTKIFDVKAPLELTRSPSLALVAGQVIVAPGAGAQSARRKKQPARSANHTSDLRLTNGRFILKLGPAAHRPSPDAEAPPANLLSPIVQALSKFGFNSLQITRSEILITNAGKRQQKTKPITINGVSALLNRRSSGVIDAKGSLRFRGQTLKFTASFDSKTQKGDHGLAPLKFELKNSLMAASFDGLAAMSKGLQFQGRMTASAPNLRQLARWLSSDFPKGPGLRNFKVSGAASLVGRKLAFENADVLLDSNKATGGLVLDFGAAMPSVEGTLATKQLTLDTYFLPPPQMQQAFASDLLQFGKSMSPSPQPYDLSLPSIRHFDADIRLSADAVQVAGYKMGRTAVAVSLRGGKMLADIAEIELAGGHGIGQVTADMSGQVPHFAIRGKVDDVDISQVSQRLLGSGALNGLGRLILNLDGSGENGRQIMRALSGNIRLSLPDGGSIGVDPNAMVRAAKQSNISGWKGLRRSTRFARMKARFSAQNGIFKTEVMEASSRELRISCSGRVNLPRRHLDLKVRVDRTPASSTPAKAAASGPKTAGQKNVNILRVSGGWTAPVIRLEKLNLRRKAQPGSKALQLGDLAPDKIAAGRR